ncbi:MAG TPA: sulfite exporter TauE/SafE family protein [Acidimicrobiales bacterium]
MRDVLLAICGGGVGLIVGLTGMGGGAVMTPLLVLGFGVDPLSAVSSDLVVSLVMKPLGGRIHMRHGTVRRDLVAWLCAGSVPAAFSGVLLLRALGDGRDIEDLVQTLLGVALCVAVVGMLVRPVIGARRTGSGPVQVHPLRTIAIGVLGGLVVGMTSVGSGSLMIVLLMALYPQLAMRELVGTDLVQAVPLVASAALAHAIFGDVHLATTVALVVGAIPGVWVGAHLSARASDRMLRPVLVGILAASAAKLLDASTVVTVVAVLVALVPAWWVFVRMPAANRALVST